MAVDSTHPDKVKGQPYDGVDPHYVGMLSNYVGQIGKHYGTDSHAKMLLFAASGMICSQWYIKNTFFMNNLFSKIMV